MAGRRHTLADHALGAQAGHTHGPGESDHEHDGDDNLVADGSRDLEEVSLLSIGVDVGSSGVQVAFSRLAMRGPGEPLAMRRQAKARETLYLSPVSLTPFIGDAIDAARLRAIVDRAYVAAGLTPDDIDTGAVIMTGAAAARSNAAAIMDALARDSGDLVATVAGDRMEALLAAYGSGCVAHSRREGTRLLNIDIGGATTKIALVEAGRVVAATALPVGGRLAVFTPEGVITRLDAAGAAFARRVGADWSQGGVATKTGMQAVAEVMAEDIIAALKNELAADGYLIPPIADYGRMDGVIVSGGVAEYVYARETRDFGDLGWRLGRALRRRWDAGEVAWPLLEGGERIRATVLGASAFSVQMSGATSCVTSHAALLPRRNLPVLQPHFDFYGDIVPAALANAIRARRVLMEDDDPARETAFAFRWRGEPSHERLFALAQGIVDGLADRIAARTNLYLLFEGDVGANVGAILREECGVASDILALDGVALRDFDYVDIGRMRLPSGMIPLTVKSLLFPPTVG